VSLVVATACASDEGGVPDQTPSCTPGKQEECPCPGGGKGVQVCGADGASWGSCTGCASSSGGASGSGGTAAGGSSGATGGTSGAGGASGSGGSGATGPFSLTDSLKDGNPKGKAVGGSYGSSGWTVTQKTDRIWYALPRLVQGSIEFTVTGITTSNLTLADHEIFSMYDAGHGITEPINYNPEFRDNHYKQLIRIYGQQVPDRLGEQKFIMLMCPDGAPGYGTCKCAKSYYDGDGWWGGNPSWDGSPSKLKVSWGNGKATYSRDGVDVWTNDYSATGLTFGPAELHFTIGCARHDAIGDAGMPIGATFSDVVVQGVQGPVATCN
jgi:hypothetical protein